MFANILFCLTFCFINCSSYQITKKSFINHKMKYECITNSIKCYTKSSNLYEDVNLRNMNLPIVDKKIEVVDADCNKFTQSLLPLVLIAVTGILTFSSVSYADNIVATIPGLDVFNPMSFQPVCPASDGVYQFLKAFLTTIIGNENIAEYGPLIASVLLRVRLELCVFESFLYEAVLPFIRLKGLSWVLPLHETLETFIAGTVFAIASNFILLGSTKIFAVLLIYIDALFGIPILFIGSFLQRIPIGKPVTERFGQTLQLIGNIIRTIRRAIESFDTFVGRYLVFGTSIYIAFKFCHFKFFNGIIPF